MISVVVITYNKVESLECCIKLLLNQSYKNYEVIVIDDGSTSRTQQLVRVLQRKNLIIKYFRQENKGRGSARNLGMREARGNIIAFTDDDCIVPQNWLENIKKTLEDNPEISAVGGAIVNNNKNPFGEASYILNFSSWLPVGRKRYVKDIPTANIAYKKEAIRGLAFPEDRLGLDYEETIFNLKLIKKGKKILFDPAMIVNHNPSINNYKNFLKNQQRKALSYLLRGYKLHGLAGILLIKFRLLNLLCPRIVLIFLRCLKIPKYTYNFIIYFPIILRGELERGLLMLKTKKGVEQEKDDILD